MTPINPELFDRLEKRLGVKKAAVYAKIQAIAGQKFVDRESAALILAAKSGIGIQKYASPDKLAAIRGAVGAGNTMIDDAPALGSPGVTKPSKAKFPKAMGPAKVRDNSVFVVHGRDEGLRKAMFAFLRALSLNPLEWSKAVLQTSKGGANPHVDDIIDGALRRVQAVVVIFSPDDLACLRPCFVAKGEAATEGKPKGQPRPNVIFEAGMALARHPEKTLLVQIGTVKSFSDIAGKHLVRLSNDASKRADVANRLKKIGCIVDQTGTDWLKDGDFTPKKDKKLVKKKLGGR
jgi:predicted nucleotide-binding protein